MKWATRLSRVKVSLAASVSLSLLIFFISLNSFTYIHEHILPNLAASLELDKSVSSVNVPTGETFTYTLQYRCASLVENCIGTVITDPLPPEVEFVSLVGSTHTINEVYNSGTHTVSFTLQNTLLAGTIGEVQVQVRFPNGSTPNNTIANNIATITADNAPDVSASVSTTAFAEAKILLEKYIASGGAAGGLTTYGFQVCNTGYSGDPQNGTLNLEDIYIIDTLPPGAIYIDSRLSGGTLTSYDPVTNIIEFTVSDLEPNECKYPRITVELPDPPYIVNTTVTNVAYLHLTPVGESQMIFSDTLTHDMLTPNADVGGFKNISHSSLYQGENGSYDLDFEINGTEALDDFCMVDTIPEGIEIRSISHGGHYYGGLGAGDDIVTITYTTNLNGPQVVAGSPFNRYLLNGTLIDVAAELGLVAGGPEYITSISWCYGDMPAGFGIFSDIVLSFDVRPDAPVGIATNCLEFTSTTSSSLSQDCVDLDILENTNGAITYAWKRILNEPPSGRFNPGDTIQFRLLAQNPNSAGDSLANPELFDLLPTELEYVPGSWEIPSWSQNPGPPIFTETPNYNGTSRTLLSWSWTGASTVKIAPGEETNIEFKAVIANDAIAGDDIFDNQYFFTGDGVTDCFGHLGADTYDLNNNGNTTELLCFDSVAISINGLVALESEKLVIGQLDSVFTKYPDVATTVPGGIADYKLIVRNTGNLALDSIVIIDILPFVGDSGVVDIVERDSRWRPNLVGQVQAPAGVTVFYSTEGNPCRDIEQLVPTGPPSCSTPNWTSTPPTDITTVQSLKFEFGSTVLNPFDSLVLEWPMRAPVNALSTIGVQPDSIAWNSFGFIGRRTDTGSRLLAAEPIKVGVKMNVDVPGVIGDLVWIDTDEDGVQDLSETGYNGIRVELFKDDGDGIANPSLDTFINFTVTANGGYYLFPNLPEDDYFIVFHKPAPYTISPANVGGDDALDSDGIPGVLNGYDIAITPVMHLTNTDYNLDVDLGIYLSGNGAIGNYVWSDINNDGIQNESLNDGVNGVNVNLYDNANPTTIYASKITANDPNGYPGYYLFDNLPPGDYFIEFVLPSSTTFSAQGSTGTSDPIDSDANITTGRTEVFTVVANVYDDTWDAALNLSGIEVCGNGIDDDGDGQTDCLDITGTVFEDINYGGGIGRNYNAANLSAQSSGWLNDEIAVENVIVELYNSLGDFVENTTTDANGDYTFTLTTNGDYTIRVVNNSINSNRSSNSTGETIIPVQTFRTDGTTAFINEIGGANPTLVDAAENTTNANLSTLTTAITTAQSITTITLGTTDMSGLDFGYNYDVVVNTNDNGQGSLRQFILNSNELANTNLDQEDSPTSGVSFPKEPEWETSIFMIPGTGMHVIQPLTSLPSVEDPKTHVTAYTQAGSTQGTINDRTINVELFGNGVTFDGLSVFASEVQVSGFSINSFRRGVYSNSANATENFIWGNYIGVKTDGTTAASNSSNGIDFNTINDSYIGTNGDNINDANEGNLVSNSYGGIQVRNTNNILIAGNYIGTDKTGTVDFGNTYIGVMLRDATGTNYVGFQDDAANTNELHFRNILSGNGTDGVRIFESDGQVISGNYIGTDITGTVALLNGGYGVQLLGASSNNIIGTNANGDDDNKERNIISGNNGGLRLASGGTGSNNIIAGNYIGVDVTGNTALGNLNNGIVINGGFTNTQIGINGDNVNDIAERNIISGNADDAIRLAETSGNLIAGNYLGVGADGITAVPNNRGVFIATTAGNNTVGYSSAMANTNELIVGNQIKNNTDVGVAISGTGINNRISRNQIANNGNLGIDLDYDLVTANDNGDGDTGANTLLNFPVIERAILAGNNLIISGFAPMGANIEFFIADVGPSPNPLPAGYTTSFGEGAVYLFTDTEGSGNDTDASTANYTDDGTGATTTKNQNRFEFTFDVTGLGLDNTDRLTATATNSLNSTSEFSGTTIIYVIEICDDGIDNDGDGLIDCYDCEDCFDSTDCNDNDNDGVGDFCDLDDDNDGIPDLVECPDPLFDYDSGFLEALSVSGGLNVNGDQILSVGDYLLMNDIISENGITYDAVLEITDMNLGGGEWILILSIPSIDGRIRIYNGDMILDPWISYRITFVQDGTATAMNPLGTTANVPFVRVVQGDIDGHPSNSMSEVAGINTSVGTTPFQESIGSLLNENGFINSSGPTGFTTYRGTLPVANSPDLSLDPNHAVQYYFSNVSSINLVFGATSNTSSISNRTQLLSINNRTCDCDNDGILNYLDLDSDNDGIFDVDESGHTALDANEDGVIDNANVLSGINGLFDGVETGTDSDTINYILSDSEFTPDGVYDFCELDSDDDGCFDAEEESVPDGDGDGIAATGIPTVDNNNGLVMSITYTDPPNNTWQNPLIGPCLPEVCSDGIDNDLDGWVDCDDSDCGQLMNPSPGFPIDFSNNDCSWIDYYLDEIGFFSNPDGTMTISGSINNGIDADFDACISTPCGANDGWLLNLTLYDRMSWTEFQTIGGSANMHANCAGQEVDLDYWNLSGTLVGTGCNAGRTLTITGPKAPYRLQIGNGGISTDPSCSFGMSTWFDLNEGGTPMNADIYAFINEDCYNIARSPDLACSVGLDSDGDGVSNICDLDDDNDGIPDVDECYSNIIVSTPDGIQDNSYPVGYWDAEYYRGYYGVVGSTGWTSDADETNSLGSPVYLGESFLGFNASTFHENRSFTANQSPTSIAVAPANYIGVNWNPTNNNPFYQIHYNRQMDVSGSISFNGFFDDVVEVFVNGTRVLFIGQCCGGVPTGNYNIAFNAGDNVQIRYTNLGFIGSFNFTLSMNFLCNLDTDNDGLTNDLDLDSDNDGIFDLDEAGHSAADTNDDGIIDGSDTGSGNNGLFDAVETTAESDVINYTISDSETTPDGDYDPYELDSDNDGCYDAEEESVNDPDNDGIAGFGIPSVNPSNGLVTSITYTSPPNNIWQNPLIGPCLPEICNDGIDNDGDGNEDCLDADCFPIAEIILPTNTCPNTAIDFVATDAGVGATYVWDFGAGASPATATGVGPHSVSYTTCGDRTISLDVSNNGCTVNDTETFSVTDIDAPVFTGIPNDTIVDCHDLPVTPVVTVADNCASSLSIEAKEVVLYHPTASWNTGATCDLIYNVSNIIIDDNGTPANTTDDSFFFDLTLIGQNTGASWQATIEGANETGSYNSIQTYGPYPVTTNTVSFIITDLTTPTCTTLVSFNLN